MPHKRRVKVRRIKPLPKLPSRRHDASKQTVAAVLVVAILVSLLGTWFVLDSITSSSQPTYSPSSQLSGVGEVSVAVIGAQPILQQKSVGGQVSIDILK